MGVTVITPSLPSRARLLADAMASVADQALKPDAHLVAVDYERVGPAEVRNRLLRSVASTWVAFLDDDDLIDPWHLATLVDQGERADADVVIPYCRFAGETIPPRYHNRPYDREALRRHGIFPITVLARTEAIAAAGGFPAERYEDWAMWNRIADMGAHFMTVPEITWTYRLGRADHRTYGQNVA